MVNTNTIDLGGGKHTNESGAVEAFYVACLKRDFYACCNYFISMFALMQHYGISAF